MQNWSTIGTVVEEHWSNTGKVLEQYWNSAETVLELYCCSAGVLEQYWFSTGVRSSRCAKPLAGMREAISEQISFLLTEWNTLTTQLCLKLGSCNNTGVVLESGAATGVVLPWCRTGTVLEQH